MKKHNVFNLEQKSLCKLIARLYMVIIQSQISHTKFLGLNIDNTLSWRSHIEGIVNKLSCLLYV